MDRRNGKNNPAVAVPRHGGAEAWMENSCLYPPHPSFTFQCFKLRIRAYKDKICPLCRCVLCVHAAGDRGLCHIFKFAAWPLERQGIKGVSHRAYPCDNYFSFADTLQKKEGAFLTKRHKGLHLT